MTTKKKTFSSNQWVGISQVRNNVLLYNSSKCAVVGVNDLRQVGLWTSSPAPLQCCWLVCQGARCWLHLRFQCFSTWEVADAPSLQQCLSRVHYTDQTMDTPTNTTLWHTRAPLRCFKSPRRIGCDYCGYRDCYHRLPSRPLSAEHFPARSFQLSALFTLMWAGGNIAERPPP